MLLFLFVQRLAQRMISDLGSAGEGCVFEGMYAAPVTEGYRNKVWPLPVQ